MNALSFDAPTSTLLFVPSFFKAREMGRFVSWRLGVKAGGAIRVGSELADIFWDDGTEEIILSPVAGRIQKTNRRIIHSRLHRVPAQWALILD